MTDSLYTVILTGTLCLALEARVRFNQTVLRNSVLYKNVCFPCPVWIIFLLTLGLKLCTFLDYSMCISVK